MQGKLGSLIFRFQQILELAVPEVKLDSVKQFIVYVRRPFINPELIMKIQRASSFFDLFQIVRIELCSLVNYSILTEIANEFKLTEAFTLLEKYEIEEKNYRNLLYGSEFAKKLEEENEFLSHCPTTENTIVLKLKWASVTPLTITEFERIVKELFLTLFPYIHVYKVQRGSIIVTMCVPETIINVLSVMAKNKVHLLEKIGATGLTIGGTIILTENEYKVE